MFREFIDLSRPIQVVTGDYRNAWMDAKITSFKVEDSNDPESEDIVEVSFGVEFEDGCTQWVQDIYGWNRSKWRYKDVTTE